MSIEDIRSYRNAQPFEPFDIVLDDDTAVFVERAERVALAPSGRFAYVFEKNDLSCVEVARVKTLKRHGAGSSRESING